MSKDAGRPSIGALGAGLPEGHRGARSARRAAWNEGFLKQDAAPGGVGEPHRTAGRQAGAQSFTVVLKTMASSWWVEVIEESFSRHQSVHSLEWRVQYDLGLLVQQIVPGTDPLEAAALSRAFEGCNSWDDKKIKMN